MQSYLNIQNDNDSLRELFKKNNHYVNLRLGKFIEDQLDAINTYAKKIKLTNDQIDMLHQRFYAKLKELRFSEAYRTKAIDRDIRDSMGFELDARSFVNYIYKNAPEFKDIQSWVRIQLKAVDRKHELLTVIDTVVNAVNQYAGVNKDQYKRDFANQMRVLRDSVTKGSPLEAEMTVMEEIHPILDKLQANENTHYQQFGLFRGLYKSNSSLQPRIDAARDNLKAIQLPTWITEKSKLIEKIKAIKRTINEYAGDGKRTYVNKFNSTIAGIEQNLQNAANDHPSDKEMQDEQKKVRQALHTLQTEENDHYNQFSIFAGIYKANSTLQSKIDTAKSQINQLVDVGAKPRQR